MRRRVKEGEKEGTESGDGERLLGRGGEEGRRFFFFLGGGARMQNEETRDKESGKGAKKRRTEGAGKGRGGRRTNREGWRAESG